jgi:hypothetical protein
VDFGTLLGAVRDGELIPWDEDADFGYDATQGDLFKSLVAEVADDGYHLDVLNPDVTRLNYSYVNKIHVDLFPWTRDREGILHTNFDPGHSWPGMYDRGSFSASYVDRLGSVTLHGRSYPAPSPVDQFLRDHRYGPDFMTPKRGMLETGLYPNFRPEEFTEVAQKLVAELGTRARRLDELKAGLPGHSTVSGRWWVDAALPRAGRPADRKRWLERVPPGEDTPAMHELVATLARLDRAIGELEDASWRVWARRQGRRASVLSDQARHPSTWITPSWRRVRYVAHRLATAPFEEVRERLTAPPRDLIRRHRGSGAGVLAQAGSDRNELS